MAATSIHHTIHNSQSIAPNLNIKTRDGLAPPPTLVNGEFPITAMSSEICVNSSPETVTSTSVPNPFAISSTERSGNMNNTGMTVVNWSSQHYKEASTVPYTVPQRITSGLVPVPNPFQVNQNESFVQVSGMCGTKPRLGTSKSTTSSMNSDNNGAIIDDTIIDGTSSTGSNFKKSVGVNQRRQKRLERNRESARLSRRRRKQYLEILEEKVKNLSIEMDKGRRNQVAIAIDTIKEKKRVALQSTDPSAVQSAEHVLNSTSLELRVAATFLSQQVKSLSTPPHVKFMLWLSLQNDSYFRGGRAASERLSAARIGERMLSSGSDRVPPAHGMWPLFCNEVGLSYDQEEKVRQFQRNLVASHESWLHRHTASASIHLLNACESFNQAISCSTRRRQSAILNCLSNSQKQLFLSWTNENTEKISKEYCKAGEYLREQNYGFELGEKNHDAANLYILNNRIQSILSELPTPAPLVNSTTLKRFCRRPSFESLGSSMSQDKKDGEGYLSRDVSFSSIGSLKRNASVLSDFEDEDRQQISCVPEEAENAAKDTIDSVLGFVKDIIPKTRPQPTVSSSQHSFTMPPPPVKNVAQVQNSRLFSTSTPAQHEVRQILPSDANLLPVKVLQPMSLAYSLVQHPKFCHNVHPTQRVCTTQPPPPIIPAFLPPHLNVVPEEGFLPNNVPEDFLFDLSEEDWAIGKGFEMVDT
mmetsp:Transcript_7736/g.8839  ORF Transcript_7736/g.8839 Transcript_7736/m.8839 type:complete len:700 (-) Transcript_7736:364-2463(-)|eukprot:CAMPEP_0194138254 /NCGR_PEP_ID=MMETSP0152-20130528/8091_1 /TAXON_ID=1049557 /ORGANISM="Thalassiothrix antarctica, Strain L6-D1" /LENGTH=699 /DNA_ID=CAMNT_0038835667 /DNA_START=232 /DNA_END=2331 /DNA_ORIENTATION=+